MKVMYIAALALFCNTSFAQTAKNYADIPVETAEQCTAANPAALEAANYILSTPYVANDIDRRKTLSFILKWMNASPDFTFNIDGIITKLTKDNDDLMGLYLAAMTKYCIEHPSMAENQEQVKLNAVILVLNYCEDPKNNIRMSKYLKRLSAAKANGKLEQELKEI